MKKIPKNIIQQSYSYEAYRNLVDILFAKQQTTGIDHSDFLLNYTKTNIARMNRLDRKAVLTDTTIEVVKGIEKPMIWLVITEGWCGDAAQIVPVINKMASLNDKIQLRCILRDEHLDIMDAFLTNGGRSIPKILILDARSLEILDSWGPRPAEMQNMMMQAKNDAATETDIDIKQYILSQASLRLHTWYAKDKTKTTQKEFLAILEQ